MDLFLNLVLLTLGTTATLAAFGGDTWHKGPEPLVRRVTPRGWLSLGCLTLTLILGGVKELRSERSAEQLARSSQEAQLALAKANAEIGAMSRNLADASQRLSDQSRINLLSVLANGDPVRESSLWIGLGTSSFQAKDVVEFLFSSIPQEYRPAAKARVHFTPYLGLSSEAAYTYESGKLALHGAQDETFPPRPRGDLAKSSIHSEVHLPRFLSKVHPAPTKNGDTESFILSSELPSGSRYRNAAIAFRDMQAGYTPGSLTFSLERNFRSEAERRAFLAQYPQLKEAKAWIVFGAPAQHRVEYVLPKALQQNVADYWRAAIRSIEYHVYLDSAAHLMISGKAELDAITHTASAIKVNFKATKQPELRVGIEAIR